MRPVVTLLLSAALALTLQPAVAQSPGAATMPAGTQNPALAQPRLVPAPGGPLSQAAPQPGGYRPGPQPSGDQPSPQPSGYQPGPQPTSAPAAPQPGGFQPGPQPGGFQPGPQPGGYPPAPAPQPSSFQPGPQPGGFQPGPTPDSPSAGVLAVPGGAGGLCECLIGHDRSLAALDKTKMHQTCLGNVAACQAACQTDHAYSFVPHAVYTCPLQPEKPGNVALNDQSAVRYLSHRR